jgi:hypothetical protein
MTMTNQNYTFMMKFRTHQILEILVFRSESLTFLTHIQEIKYESMWFLHSSGTEATVEILLQG